MVASAYEVQVVSILNIKISVPKFLFIRILLCKKNRLYKFCKISKNTFLFSLLGHALLAKEMKRIPTKLLLSFLDFVEDAFVGHFNFTDFLFAALAFSEFKRLSYSSGEPFTRFHSFRAFLNTTCFAKSE